MIQSTQGLGAAVADLLARLDEFKVSARREVREILAPILEQRAASTVDQRQFNACTNELPDSDSHCRP